MDILIIIPFITATIGFVVGRVNTFRAEKQKVYSESIQPILATIFKSQYLNIKERELLNKEFNKANLKLLLYSNNKVAKALQQTTRLIKHAKSEDEIISKLKITLAEMRRDIQLTPCGGLKDSEFTHFYFDIK